MREQADHGLACSPFLAAGLNIRPDECGPGRLSYKALLTNALSVFQSEVDHPISVDLDFAFPTEFALALFHCASFRADVLKVVNVTVPSGSANSVEIVWIVRCPVTRLTRTYEA